MRSFFRCTLLALPLLGGVVAEKPSTQEATTSIYAGAQEAFQDLLNVLPEESLQAALNSLTKFKEGIFESHRRGVEHVHNSSPALATRLIVAAVLKKRQVTASNGTTPAEPSSNPSPSPSPSPTPEQPQSSDVQPSSQAPPESTQQQSTPPESTPQQSTQQPPQSSAEAPATTADAPATTADAPATTAPDTRQSRPVFVPVEVTTTNNVGSTVIQTSEVLSEVTASVEVTVTRTTTNKAGSTVAVTTQEVRPAVIRTTTDSRGSSVAITSAAEYAPTRGQVMTTTNAEGSTFLTTYTPGGGRVSSVKLVTTTDAEGQPTTLTSITYVDPTDLGKGGDQGTNGGGAATTPTGKPGVQSGSANKNNAAVAGLAGLGAFAFFF
jgi:hypothetical protein